MIVFFILLTIHNFQIADAHALRKFGIKAVHDIIWVLLHFDPFLPDKVVRILKEQKTDQMVYASIRKAVEEALKQTFFSLQSPNERKRIAIEIMQQCELLINAEHKEGVVSYRLNVSLDERKLFFRGFFQYFLWKKFNV